MGDVKGAEVGVLTALLPRLSLIDNLIVEISPGWWSRFHDLSPTSETSQLRNRSYGASLFASLLREEHGRHDVTSITAPGFAAARTSTGRVIRTRQRMYEYLM